MTTKAGNIDVLLNQIVFEYVVLVCLDASASSFVSILTSFGVVSK